MDSREEKGARVDASEPSAALLRSQLEARSVKVRWDRSPVEGMMTLPLRSFWEESGQQDVVAKKRIYNQDMEQKRIQHG
jgi:hypothetical protein